MSERKTSTLKQRSAFGARYSTVTWAVVFGFAAALILTGALYYSFEDELILKRSIAITPSSLVAPVTGPRVPVTPKPK